MHTLDTLELPAPDDLNAASIRALALESLSLHLIAAWGELLQDSDSEVRRKTAKDVAEVIGIVPSRGPGGGHESSSLNFAGLITSDAMEGLIRGIGDLAKGEMNELPKPSKTPDQGLAVPWREVADEPAVAEDPGSASSTPPASTFQRTVTIPTVAPAMPDIDFTVENAPSDPIRRSYGGIVVSDE